MRDIPDDDQVRAPGTTRPPLDQGGAKAAVRQLMKEGRAEPVSLKSNAGAADSVTARGYQAGHGRAVLGKVGGIARISCKKAITRLRAYRPTRTHVAIFALALIMLLYPLLIPGIIAVTFCVALISYLTLGPDRVVEMIADVWRRLDMSRPDLAEQIRQTAEDVAKYFEGWLARLPGDWSERISLPDFARSDTIATVEHAPDPFDRLAREAGQEGGS